MLSSGLPTNTERNATEVITFKVGKSVIKKNFVVHKEFACYYSPLLKGAFNSNFIEGSTHTHTLDDVDEETFSLFFQWLYSQRLDAPLEEDETKNQPTEVRDNMPSRNLQLSISGYQPTSLSFPPCKTWPWTTSSA